MAQLRFQFKNGHWVWDKYVEGLAFVSHELINVQKDQLQRCSNILIPLADKQNIEIQFRDEVGLLDKIRFRKHYQRKIEEDESEAIVLQDIKDVAFFTADPHDLSYEIVEFLHTPIVDRLLKALIIYFQFYLKVWRKMINRREEKKNKLTQPIVTVLENLIRDDLASLRSMVSCEYGAIILGAAESQKFHHLANKNGASLSGRDRRIFNMAMKISLRVIWLALQRPNISLLELELTRLSSTDSFNTFVHQGKKNEKLQTSIREDQILQGPANTKEPRLLQRSPLGKEILIGNHDHRMLSIGKVTFPPSDARLRFLEACYSAPEELFAELGITIGILGLKRSDFDEMLVKKKPRKVKKDDEIEEEEEKEPEITFTIPDVCIHSDDEIPDSYPTLPPKYIQSEKMKKTIEEQREMWKDVVRNAHLGLATPSIASYSTS